MLPKGGARRFLWLCIGPAFTNLLKQDPSSLFNQSIGFKKGFDEQRRQILPVIWLHGVKERDIIGALNIEIALTHSLGSDPSFLFCRFIGFGKDSGKRKGKQGFSHCFNFRRIGNFLFFPGQDRSFPLRALCT